MKGIIMLLFLITSISYSQDSISVNNDESTPPIDLSKDSIPKFLFNEEGLTEFIVVEIDSLSQEYIYKSAINWIKETYNSVDDVIKMTIDNQKIKINGSEKNAFYVKVLGTKYYKDVRYTIELSFKNGRYRFKPLSLEAWNDRTEYTSAGWKSVSLEDGSSYYKRSGKIRGTMSSYVTGIPSIFNRLNISLNNYLLNKKDTNNDIDSDW